MKRFLITAVLLVVITFVALFLLADVVLEKVSNKALTYLIAESGSRGIKVHLARFGDVGLRGLAKVRWKKFVAVLNVPHDITIAPGEDIVVSIEELNLSLAKLFKGVAKITAHDIAIRVERGIAINKTSGKAQEGLNNGELRVVFPLIGNGKGISALALVEIPKRALQFLQQGRTQIPFDFKAESIFKIGKSTIKADITTKNENNEYFLVMSPDDVRRISKKLREDLTDSEINLLSTHPLLAPALFKIRNRARVKSETARAKDAAVPEDAYRHVLWSYLLTKEFGPEFAKQVTDAHEIGAVKRTSEADHQMDYNNNKVGRDYAKAGYAEDMLLELAKTDAQVIRIPAE